MSDSYTEFQRDVQAYERRCQLAGESPHLRNGWADPYCAHAKALALRVVEALVVPTVPERRAELASWVCPYCACRNYRQHAGADRCDNTDCGAEALTSDQVMEGDPFRVVEAQKIEA